MSESPSPAVAGHAAVHAPQALTPEAVEAVLADFRSWLQRLAAVPPGFPPDDRPTSAAAPPGSVDLHTLLGQFIALRHEVNLQTKAARAQQEQNGEALRQLTQALESLDQAQEEAQQAAQASQEEALRPLLKTLVDVADALDLARRKMLQAQEGVWSALDRQPVPAAAPESSMKRPSDPWWRKWFGGGRTEAAAPPTQPPRGEVTGPIRELLDSLILGYTMSLQRIERALGQHGLERIECLGAPFDPERMEVMDAVADSGRPPGEVLEEVRRGYLWRGRIFRYALVRVAKS